MSPSNTQTKSSDQSPARKIVTYTGVVESDQRDKTRTVVVRYQAKHPKYGKYIRRRTVLQAHDEANVSRLGDMVEVGPCRPLSRTKTWKVLRIIDKDHRESEMYKEVGGKEVKMMHITYTRRK